MVELFLRKLVVVNIMVSLKDENDNALKFEKDYYEVLVFESIFVNVIVV